MSLAPRVMLLQIIQRRGFYTFVLLTPFISGCAVLSSSQKVEVNRMAAQLKEKEQELLFLRDQNIVLRQKLAKENSLQNELKAPNSEAQAATLIHRARKALSLKKVVLLEELNSELLRRFPVSTEVEESLYLLGKLYFEQGSWGRALGPLNQLIEGYPYSSRRASALLYKAKSYKALNLLTIAEKLFEEIKNKYPGSPEYFKASYELDVSNSQSKL